MINPLRQYGQVSACVTTHLEVALMVLSVVELDGRAPLRVPLASNAWKFLHPTTVNASLQCSRIHIHRASREAVHECGKM